jgi:hypothetical protein
VHVHCWQVSVTPLGVFGGWLAATPAAGVIPPGGSAAVALAYDVSQNEFQGAYQAEVLLTTSARPVAKACMPCLDFTSPLPAPALCMQAHCWA